MLLWRIRSITPEGDGDRIECHLMRRDMEYRLSIRVGKNVVAHETFRTPTAAAERAEQVRRMAKEGGLAFLSQQQADERELSAKRSQ